MLNSYQMFNKGSVAYNETAVFNIVGKLDIDKFSNTIRKLIERHESLRTTITLVNGEPRQKCHKEPNVVVKHIKLKEGEQCEDVVRNKVKSLINPFSLHNKPLIRPILIEKNEHDYLFFLDIHHIISDGLSQDIFVRDFLDLYQDKKLEPLVIQYKDYTIWQSEIENSQRITGQKYFWKKSLASFNELNLPIDFSRDSLSDDVGERVFFAVDINKSNVLISLYSSSGATNFMIYISTYYLLLADITNQMKFCIGTPILGRPQSELQNVIGMFVNLLPISLDFNPDLSFREILSGVSETVLSSFENSEVKIEDIARILNIKPKKNRMPIFDTVFSYMNIGMPDFELPNLKLSRYEIEQEGSRFDLALLIREVDLGYEFSFEYKKSLFHKKTINLLIARYREIIDFLIKHPDDPVKNVFNNSYSKCEESQEDELLEFCF